MSTVSIDVMNAFIAKFMGYKRVTVGYSGTEEETEWQRNNEQWMDKVGITMVGDYYVDVENDEWMFCDDSNYDKSWDALRPVVEKIHGLAVAGDAINAITEEAIFTFSIFAPLKDVHAAVYQFITWFNQKKQTNERQPEQ